MGVRSVFVTVRAHGFHLQKSVFRVCEFFIDGRSQGGCTRGVYVLVVLFKKNRDRCQTKESGDFTRVLGEWRRKGEMEGPDTIPGSSTVLSFTTYLMSYEKPETNTTTTNWSHRVGDPPSLTNTPPLLGSVD